MTSIWKELLFMHGHLARPEDVLEEVFREAAQAAAQREARARTEPLPDTEGLVCGGCA